MAVDVGAARGMEFQPRSLTCLTMDMMNNIGGIAPAADDGLSAHVMRGVARLIVGLAAYNFGSLIGMFYNGIAVAGKLTLFLGSYMTDQNVMGFSKGEYLEDVKKHLLYGVYDFVGRIFPTIAALTYTILPNVVDRINVEVIRLVEGRPAAPEAAGEAHGGDRAAPPRDDA
jgi:hypothetical protein